jgi:anti-sigma regulatory factor (Ser/Thr protein kinase)
VDQWTLPFDMSAAGRARALVEEQLSSSPRVADISLVVSELVTNAVEHGEPPVMFGIDSSVDTSTDPNTYPNTVRIRVTVSDEGGGEPRVRAAADHAIGGRGLALVEMLASRWQWRRDGKRLTVWAEFDSAH